MLAQENAMIKTNSEELKKIDGGSSITGTLINAISNGVETVFEIGRSLGSAFRRIKEDKLCRVQ